MAYEFEAQNVLLVLGEYIWQREVIPPAEQWATGVDATSGRSASTPPTSAWRSRWSWSRSTSRS